MTFLPARLEWTRAEVQTRMYLVRHTVGPFQYTLRVPRNWEAVTPVANRVRSSRLAAFVAPFPVRAEIEVTVVHLAREVDPADFSENEILASGAEIVERRDVYGPTGWVADFASRRRRDGRTYVTRTTMAKDASALYQVHCSAVEEAYPALSDLFLAALASFRLTSPTHRTLAEKTRSYNYVDPYVFGFQYPASWNVVPEQSTLKLTSLRLDNQSGGRCAGRLYVTLQAARTIDPPAALRDTVTRITGTPADSLEFVRRGAPPIAGFDQSFETVLPVFKHVAMECRALLLTTDAARLAISVYGPHREISPAWWAVNKRAYEIVTDSVSVIL